MRRFSVCFLSLTILTVFLGCSKKEQPKTYAVTGRVTLEGAPLADATVMFQPVEGGSFGYGVSDADGLFVISTFEVGDGAIPGEHQVVVTKRAPAAELAGGDADGKSESQPKIEDFKAVPKRYSNAETSGLKVIVGEDIETVELKLSSVE